MEFEGHEGLTSAPPSNGKQHWARKGVNETSVSTSSSLPPGHPTFSKNDRKGAAKTSPAYVKTIGD